MRSRLLNPRQDLISDNGAILLSLIQGEQLEYPIVLNTGSFVLNAVCVEGFNLPSQKRAPSAIRPGGVRTPLTIRKPNYRGTWNPIVAYDVGDLVVHEGRHLTRRISASPIDSSVPVDGPIWNEISAGTVYLRLPSELSMDWQIQPSVNSPVYGFIEVAVSETGGGFPRTWKPVRGLIEYLYSPTL